MRSALDHDVLLGIPWIAAFGVVYRKWLRGALGSQHDSDFIIDASLVAEKCPSLHHLDRDEHHRPWQ